MFEVTAAYNQPFYPVVNR